MESQVKTFGHDRLKLIEKSESTRAALLRCVAGPREEYQRATVARYGVNRQNYFAFFGWNVITQA